MTEQAKGDSILTAAATAELSPGTAAEAVAEALGDPLGPPRPFFLNVLETYVARVFLILVGLVTTVVISRTLGPEGRGYFAVAVSLGAIGIQFANLGLHASNTFAVSRSPQDLPRLLANSLMVSILGGGMTAVLLAAIFLIWPQRSPLPTSMLLLAVFWIPVGLAYLLAQGLLLGLTRVRAYNLVEIAQRVLTLAVIFGVVFAGKPSPENMFGAGFVVLWLAVGWMIWQLNRIGGGNMRPSLVLFKQDIQYGLRAYVTLLMGVLVLRVGLFVVQYDLGPAPAGHYSIATTIAENVGILPAVVGSILFPTLCASQDIPAKLAFTKKVALVTLLCTVPLLLLIGALATPVIRLLFGVQFLPAAAPLIWLLPGVLAMGLNAVIVQFLNSIDYPLEIVWTWLGTCIVCGAGTVWAVPRYGFNGAAVAYSLSCIFLLAQISLLTLRTAKKHLPAGV